MNTEEWTQSIGNSAVCLKMLCQGKSAIVVLELETSQGIKSRKLPQLFEIESEYQDEY